jgi:hypothetical protein
MQFETGSRTSELRKSWALVLDGVESGDEQENRQRETESQPLGFSTESDFASSCAAPSQATYR